MTMKFSESARTAMRAAMMEVVDAVRRDADIAAHCGISRQAVCNMKARGWVAAEHVNAFVEIAAKHRLVTYPHKLRPDLYIVPVPAKKGARA